MVTCCALLTLFQLVQRDVESHGKTILSVIKLCERYSQGQEGLRIDRGVDVVKRESPLEKAQHWERRWHLLYLKCLEWQFYIEERINNFKTEVSHFQVRNSRIAAASGSSISVAATAAAAAAAADTGVQHSVTTVTCL